MAHAPAPEIDEHIVVVQVAVLTMQIVGVEAQQLGADRDRPGTRLRDRLLFAVPFDTGMRIGEVLGLRHDDLAVAEREVRAVSVLPTQMRPLRSSVA